MNTAQALAYLKTVLQISDTSQDTMLGSYLDMAAFEIIQYKYSLIGVPTGQTEPDAEDAMVWVFAVVAGYNDRGAENQTSHNENQIYRTFHYTDMVEYIRNHIIPYAKLR